MFEYDSSKYALLLLVAAMVLFITSKYTKKLPPYEPLLQPDRWQRVTYISSQPDGLGWTKYRFKFPKGQPFGLPPGQHMLLRVNAYGAEMHEHAVVPIEVEEEKGQFSLMFEDDELSSKWNGEILRMLPEESVELRGPVGDWTYTANSTSGIGLMARGKGILPMLHLARAVATNKQDETKVRLLAMFETDEHIFAKREMDRLAAGYFGKFKPFIILNKEPKHGFAHHFPHETIEEDQIRRMINIVPAPGVLMITCGDEKFIRSTRPLLEEIGYTPGMRREVGVGLIA